MIKFDGINFKNEKEVNAYKKLMNSMESDFNEIDKDLIDIEMFEDEADNDFEIINSNENFAFEDGDNEYSMELEPDRELNFY